MKVCVYVYTYFVTLVLLFPWFTSAHVPTFGGTCPAALHVDDARVSQVHYFKTTVADSVVLSSYQAQAALASDEGLTLQLTTPQRRFLSSATVFVGCYRGFETSLCDSSFTVTPPSTNIFKQNESSVYPFKIEPFTQSLYRMVVDVTLHENLAGCNRTHGSYVLRVGSSDGTEVLWGAVVGKGEVFTLSQFLSFPIFMARVHGPYGNQLYRLPLWFALAAMIWVQWWAAQRWVLDRSSSPMGAEANSGNSWHSWMASSFAMASVAAFQVVLWDVISHFVDCAHSASSEALWDALPLFLGTVALLGNVLPMIVSVHVLGAIQGWWLPRTWSVVCLMLLFTTYGVTLCVLGDLAVRVVVTVIGFVALAAVLIEYWRARGQQGLVTSTSVCCIAYSLLLLAFLGSGYWLGPSLLFLAAVGVGWKQSV